MRLFYGREILTILKKFRFWFS